MRASIKKMTIGAAVAVAACAAGLPAVASGMQEFPIEGARVARQIVDKTNAYRRAQRVAPAAESPLVMGAAKRYADFLAREGKWIDVADGRSLHRRLAAPGYDGCAWAENVYEEDRQDPVDLHMLADKAMAKWKARPGSEKALRGTRAEHVGVGVAAWTTGYHYFYRVVLVFGQDCGGTKKASPSVCAPAYEHRLARPTDRVCVTPESRKLVARENVKAPLQLMPGGGNTCIPGLVWREAFDGDAVCVTPTRRAEVRQENLLAASRVR